MTWRGLFLHHRIRSSLGFAKHITATGRWEKVLWKMMSFTLMDRLHHYKTNSTWQRCKTTTRKEWRQSLVCPESRISRLSTRATERALRVSFVERSDGRGTSSERTMSIKCCPSTNVVDTTPTHYRDLFVCWIGSGKTASPVALEVQARLVFCDWKNRAAFPFCSLHLTFDPRPLCRT